MNSMVNGVWPSGNVAKYQSSYGSYNPCVPLTEMSSNLWKISLSWRGLLMPFCFTGKPTIVYFHVTVMSLDSIDESSMVTSCLHIFWWPCLFFFLLAPAPATEIQLMGKAPAVSRDVGL